ncbi:hypothetical protein [Paucibacter soli]|uniref:hypothetical protein n=1 Tax=Paucibacter soli TaxID=3133433 RepID=UPI003099E2F9
MSTGPQHQFPELAEEVHLATEQLLREAMDYLNRLPAHPMTSALARKVQAHLDSPEAGIVRSQDEAIARAREAARRADLVSRKGSSHYTSKGLAVLTLVVEADKAILSSPAAAAYGNTSKGREFGKRVVGDLKKGVVIWLAKVGEDGVAQLVNTVAS